MKKHKTKRRKEKKERKHNKIERGKKKIGATKGGEERKTLDYIMR